MQPRAKMSSAYYIVITYAAGARITARHSPSVERRLPVSRQNSETFDMSHAFFPLTVGKLSTLKKAVRFFGPPCGSATGSSLRQTGMHLRRFSTLGCSVAANGVWQGAIAQNPQTDRHSYQTVLAPMPWCHRHTGPKPRLVELPLTWPGKFNMS